MSKKQVRSTTELSSKVRREWGFNPVTRVVQDKTKYSRKTKHKGRNDYE